MPPDPVPLIYGLVFLAALSAGLAVTGIAFLIVIRDALRRHLAARAARGTPPKARGSL